MSGARPEWDVIVDKDLQAIEAWIAEAASDQGLHGDEVAFDIVSSYIDAEVGQGSKKAAYRRLEIRRRMFGEVW